MKQAERRSSARRNLTSAVVDCLDRVGYAQTSITAVQEAAGVSRGAVLHHFPSKHALMVGTAETLLASALRRTAPRATGPLEEQIVDYWREVVDTPAGRAFLEILIACRTDAELRRDVRAVIAAWEEGLTASAFEGVLGRPIGPQPDVDALWGVIRAFMRGLLLDLPPDPVRAERRVRLFAGMLIRHLETP